MMKWVIKTGLFAVLLFLLSCQSGDLSNDFKDTEIRFNGSIVESQSIKTRYDSVYINVDKYNQNFYIMLSTQGENGLVKKFGTYKIPSGYEGKLESVDDEPLFWENLSTPHIFYSWTIPWNQEYYTELENGEVDDNEIGITFYDSSESNFEEMRNNSIYETFVGAKSLSYSYIDHGKYVDLTFFHLVSKIKIGTFQLTEASGAIQRNLKAEVTFINMPTSGTFYPNKDGKRPYIQPAAPNPNDGITYYISNNPLEDQSDIFYISPETDFSNVDFQIKLKDEKYSGYDIYYGTFATVEFVRNTPPEDFDSENGNDSKILHAGEMMTININLIPGKGPGLRLVIDKWNTEKPTESQYHTYPGLYSEAELNQLRDAFNAQTKPEDTAALERLFDSYGKTVGNKKYFPLFENVDISTSSNGNYFPIWKDYILDGQGHTLTMKTNSNNWFGGAPYFNIGPARDIYITDPSGQYSIYIDDQGFVWTYSVETNTYNKTEYFLGDLEGKVQSNNNLPAYSYNINPATGEVQYASYYNGKFGV